MLVVVERQRQELVDWIGGVWAQSLEQTVAAAVAVEQSSKKLVGRWGNQESEFKLFENIKMNENKFYVF